MENDKNEQEAYERGYDLDELRMSQTQNYGRKPFTDENGKNTRSKQNPVQKKPKRIWPILFAVCITLIVFLGGVVLYLNDRLKKAEKKPDKVQEEEKSYRICEKPEEKILWYNELHTGYTASLTTLFDVEYVSFAYGDSDNPEFSLLYRNEWPGLAETTKGEYGAWLKGKHTINYDIPLTLADDWTKLTPKLTIMGGKRYILFINEQNDLPKSIVVLEPDNMVASGKQGCFDAVQNWFTLSTIQTASGKTNEDGTKKTVDVVSLTTGHGNNYLFSASDTVLKAVNAGGSSALSYGEQYSWEITPEGIRISTLVYVNRGENYGMLNCTILPVNGTLTVSDATFGAYVSRNYDDMFFDGINTPAAAYIDDPVVLGAGTGEKLYLPNLQKVARHTLNLDHLTKNRNGYLELTDDAGNVISKTGIDVSKHNGEINWKKVKNAGISFAIVRVGFRGPGEGTLEPDERAAEYIKGAQENGLDVGVYFYSQAINEQEGIEEAEYVLNFLKDYTITMPVIFDTEYYEREGARGNKTSRKNRTAAAKAFLDTIKEAGYQPMLYASTRWSIMNIDRDALSEYPFWFAYYGENLTYRYDFDMWQYSSEGSVPGVSGDCDLDILVKQWEPQTYPLNQNDPDSGTETGTEAGKETGTETGTESKTETETEAGTESKTEAGKETGNGQ